MEIKDNGKILVASQGCAFWVWDWEPGDSPENKNTFVVDSVMAKHIHFDDIPKFIEWLKSLEGFRK